MFNEYEAVRIKATGKTGIIVDKSVYPDGNILYTVEDDEFDETASHGGSWPLYHCYEKELEHAASTIAV